MKTYQTFSSRETEKIGADFARQIVAARRSRKGKRGRGAFVVALTGELGAGKTAFVQGFVKGLGLRRRSPSPTFIIIRRQALPSGGTAKPRFKNVFHMDAYRLKKAKDLGPLGFRTIIADPENVILIEWADRIRRSLPGSALWIEFKHGKKNNERHIIMRQ